MDVALHRCGVTFVLDRAGVTGDDGASHNGMWDMSILQVVPGPAARRAARRRPACASCCARPSPSTTPRPSCGSPRARPPADLEAVDRVGGVRRARARSGARDVLIVGVGSMAAVARRGRPSGWPTRASASPSSTRAGSSRSTRRSSDLAARPPAGGQRRGQRHGSAAAARRCCSCSTTSGVDTPFRLHGIPQEFLDHAKRDAILERIGLTAQALARGIVEDVTALDAGHPLLPVEVAAALSCWFDGAHGLRRRARPCRLPRARRRGGPLRRAGRVAGAAPGRARRWPPTMTAGVSNRGTVTDAERRAERHRRSAPGRPWPTCSAPTRGGVVFGRSMTQLTYDLARALAKRLGAGRRGRRDPARPRRQHPALGAGRRAGRRDRALGRLRPGDGRARRPRDGRRLSRAHPAGRGHRRVQPARHPPRRRRDRRRGARGRRAASTSTGCT